MTQSTDRQTSVRAAGLIANHQAGCALQREFYRDEEIYRLDLERIWRRGWLFAGHSCEIPKPGDYFTLQVDTDSVVIIRSENGAIHGFHNICRHRGSLICDEPSGHAKKLVCPYHQWTYGLNGNLLACRGMPSELEKSQFHLKQVHLREL